MSRAPDIPYDRLARNPLITPAGYRRLRTMLDHPAAPVWNYQVGDRLRSEDLEEVALFADRIRLENPCFLPEPQRPVLSWIESLRPTVPMFQSALPEGFNLQRDWGYIPTMVRADIALRLEELVPLDADLSRLIVYDTSGVTGHAIQVPHHPRAMAQYHPLLEYLLEQYGLQFEFSAAVTACLNVGCQVSTVTFATVFSVWNQAGFAKLNLHERVWDRQRAQQFFDDTAPLFLTGDPLGFTQMASWGIESRPAAMISTAVALAPALKQQLEGLYSCPVIDLYSTTETGPVAFSHPDGEGLLIFPPDLYVEIVDQEGFPVPAGEVGEICVTGGRNPFLPLLRYRTGDHARMLPDRQGRPCLHDLQAREPVSFTGGDGLSISMIDVSRIIREWPLVQHEFIQRADLSCQLLIQPMPGYRIDAALLREKLRELFGETVQISVELDQGLGENRPGGKLVPFRREVPSG